MVITPGKNFEGQKGFPTPSDIPSDTACRSFVLPDNDEWLGLLMGAVELLLNPHNYFNYGALSIDDTVDAWQLIVQDAYDRSLLGTCAPEIEAPYWDTAADVAETEPAESQTWYGQVVPIAGLLPSDELTFLDNLGIWAIAGFIAYAGLPGAAIAFVPVAKRFVLAFKQHDLGAIVKVLIDFAEVAEIDTHGVGEAIVNLTVTMPDDEDTHTLYVMVDESNPSGNFAQVVRKELSEEEVTPQNVRWNPDTGMMQQTPDGGTTWIDNTASDPRHGAGYQLPPRGGSDPQCDASANMVAKLKAMVGIFEAEVAQVQAANALLDIVLAFLPGVGWVIDALLAITEFLLTIGADVISGAFTDEQWRLIGQALYCNLKSDGTIDANGLASALSRIHDDCDAVVYDVLAAPILGVFAGIGEVGLSNAGATGDEVGDCSTYDCDWCYQFLWQDNDKDGWAGDCDGCKGIFAYYTIAYGWDGESGGAPSELNIEYLLPGTAGMHVTGFAIDWTMDDCQGNLDQLVRFFDVDNVQLYALNTGKTDGSSQARTTTTITGLDIHNVHKILISGQARDYMLVYNFSVSGDGYRPFPATNC